jgi:hypothetical protein
MEQEITHYSRGKLHVGQITVRETKYNETKRKMKKRNETENEETKRNEMKYHKVKRNMSNKA